MQVSVHELLNLSIYASIGYLTKLYIRPGSNDRPGETGNKIFINDSLFLHLSLFENIKI